MRKYLNSWFSGGQPCSHYNTARERFEGLQRLENAAILCLQLTALPKIKNIAGQLGLDADKAAEVLNGATMILLEKIQTGAYVFQGYEPSTYLIEVARRMLLSETKKGKRHLESLDNLQEMPDADLDNRLEQQEYDEQIRMLLNQIGDPCAQVIRLRYIDGYADEEVIRLGLAQYSSANSLKVKRSDCMQKLVAMAKKINAKKKSD